MFRSEQITEQIGIRNLIEKVKQERFDTQTSTPLFAVGGVELELSFTVETAG